LQVPVQSGPSPRIRRPAFAAFEAYLRTDPWHNIGDTTMRHDLHAPQTRTFRRLLGACGLLIAGAIPGFADTEQGIWFNHSGKGAVEIRPCGKSGSDADRLCGFIVWLKDPNNKRGEPLTDGYNADTSKRKRPICGLPVLGALRPMSDGSWDQGWVYDPEQGQAFDAAIQLKSRDRLLLTGYKGVKFFSKQFVWKRAPDDLPRCDGGNRASTVDPKKSARGGSTPKTGAGVNVAAERTALTPPRPVPAVRPGATATQ
jgi:uncharacterized protein (DUF2147 family)